jgi:hypothetical protein
MAPYWFIVYQDNANWHYAPAGNYIVDARTGELMLVLEDTGGPPQEPDYSISLNQSTALAIRQGETKVIILTLTAQSTYDASLPVHIKATGVPDFIILKQNTTSAILRTGEAVSFEIRISINPMVFNSKTESHVEIEISFLGSTTGKWIEVILQK